MSLSKSRHTNATVVLAWTGAGGPRQCSFSSIAAIDLEAEAGGEYPYARCDVHLSSGERLRIEITNDSRHGPDILAYRAFLSTFFERLGPDHRERIAFRHGPSPAKRTAGIVFSAVSLAALAGVFVFVLFSGELQQDYTWLLLPLILQFGALMALMLSASLKSGQQTFDPLSVPETALPLAPKI